MLVINVVLENQQQTNYAKEEVTCRKATKTTKSYEGIIRGQKITDQTIFNFS